MRDSATCHGIQQLPANADDHAYQDLNILQDELQYLKLLDEWYTHASSMHDQRLLELYYFASTIMHVLQSCVQVICRYSMSPAISHHKYILVCLYEYSVCMYSDFIHTS